MQGDFDNATGVRQRAGDAIHEPELFFRFRARYYFRMRFCNPYSGWEKENVEHKVDYNRANLFVPVRAAEGRQLFLPSRISEVCQEKGTQKQPKFVPGQKNLALYEPTGVGKIP